VNGVHVHTYIHQQQAINNPSQSNRESSGMAAPLIANLFTTKYAILKWLQILCCIITVLFLIDGRMQWWPYTLVCSK
jgi:hypothetical protein